MAIDPSRAETVTPVLADALASVLGTDYFWTRVRIAEQAGSRPGVPA